MKTTAYPSLAQIQAFIHTLTRLVCGPTGLVDSTLIPCIFANVTALNSDGSHPYQCSLYIYFFLAQVSSF